MFNPMVRFENVGMRYGAGPEVLRDVTFALEAGSFTFLTGLSGAGKTTLLNLIYLAEPCKSFIDNAADSAVSALIYSIPISIYGSLAQY